MSALRSIAAVMAGVGTGMVARKEDEEKKARQAKEDEWQAKVRRQQEQEWQEKAAIKTGMRDAFADRSTIEGTMTQGSGNKVFSQDPALAATMQQTLNDEAELRGDAPAVNSAATGVVAQGAKTGHQIATGPVDVAALNSPDAKMGRVTDFLMNSGDPERAITMGNAVMDQKLKSLNLKRDEVKFAEETFNRTVTDELNATPDFWGNAGKLLTRTQIGGLKDMTVTPKLSEDGKTVSMVGTKDGQESVIATYPADAEGQHAVMQRILKADGITKVTWLGAEAKRKKDEAAAALAADKIRSEIDENKAKANYYNGAGRQIRGATGTGGGAAAQQPGRIDMDAMDKALTPLFTTVDADTGAKTLNSNALLAVRSLAMRMPAAQAGDTQGAMLQAFDAYQKALNKAGNDPAKAIAILGAALAQPAPQKAEHGGAAATTSPSADTKRPVPPSKPGIFDDGKGGTQLMQPLFDLNAFRKRMQAEANQ